MVGSIRGWNSDRPEMRSTRYATPGNLVEYTLVGIA